jgi:hypothetical protein
MNRRRQTVYLPDARGLDPFGTNPASVRPGKAGLPSGPPDRWPDPEAEPDRPPTFREQVLDPEIQHLLKIAHVIHGVNKWTGERCGVFYGEGVLERLTPLERQFRCVIEINLDPDSDDDRVLAKLVYDIKFSCCYHIDMTDPWNWPSDF